MGLDSISLHLTTFHADLLIPAAIGAPTLLPGLRFSPLGEQSGSTVLCDDFAALLMVLVVVAVLSRLVRKYPYSTRTHGCSPDGRADPGRIRRRVLPGTGGARLVAGGPQAYFGYPMWRSVRRGLVAGAGLVPGLAAMTAASSGPVRRAVARQWAAFGRPLVARAWTATRPAWRRGWPRGSLRPAPPRPPAARPRRLRRPRRLP
ncbi:hypothetical protein GXW82_28760 [Streptacidiphilus sp. 4-A2]|nr:hypothetical protein [Streptacidiphilus sp. 4-A2]